MKLDFVNSVTRILDGEKRICGTALLVAKNLLITTNYVVNRALGLQRETRPPENSSVCFDLPFLPGISKWTAIVEYWSFDHRLCLLRCVESLPPDVVPAQLVNETELFGHSYFTVGFPYDFNRGFWASGTIQGATADGLVQLKDDGIGRDGFGGSPVFDDYLHNIVGMIVSHWPDQGISFMLPASKIEQHLEGIIVKHMEHTPVQVFLCHASPDKLAVRQLYVRLREDEFSPWFDEENLLPGQKWDDEIRKAVRSSDVIVVCLSKNATNKSGYVQKEIKMALDIADEKPEGHIFVIPLKLEECEVPDRLQTFQWVDLFKERGYERLKSALSFVRNQKKGK
jgi:hypothetical protein